MYSYPQYIYPPTTVPVQRFFANPHVQMNRYDGLSGSSFLGVAPTWGGKLINAGKALVNGAGDFLNGGVGNKQWGLKDADGNEVGYFGVKGLTGGILSGIGTAANQGLLKLGTGNNNQGIGVGNGIAGVGNAIGSFAENFGPMGMIIGGIAKVGTGFIGGAVNGLLTGWHKDAAKAAALDADIASNNSTRFTTSSRESLNNQLNAMDLTSNFGTVASGSSLFGRKAAQREQNRYVNGLGSSRNYALVGAQLANDNITKQDMENRLLNYSAYGGYFDNPFSHPGSGAIAYGLEQQNLANQQQFLGQMQAQQNQQQMPFSGGGNTFGCGGNKYCLGGRFFADGGAMNSHGADFTNGLVYIENGGTHEENPYQGVPMGYDEKGVPNVVEEGEIVIPKRLLGSDSDYVLSNRIPITEEFAAKYRLSPDLSVAQAAEKLTKESRENPNDIIIERTNTKLMRELRDMQEQIKQEMQQQQQQRQMAEQQYAQAMGIPQQQMSVPQEQEALNMQAVQEAAQQQAPEVQQPMMALGGNLFGRGGYFGPVNMFKGTNRSSSMNRNGIIGHPFKSGYDEFITWNGMMYPTVQALLHDKFSNATTLEELEQAMAEANALQLAYYNAAKATGRSIGTKSGAAGMHQDLARDYGLNRAFSEDALGDYYDVSNFVNGTDDRFDAYKNDSTWGNFEAVRHLGREGIGDNIVQEIQDWLRDKGVDYYLDPETKMYMFRKLAEQAAITDSDDKRPENWSKDFVNNEYLWDDDGNYIGPELKPGQYLTESELGDFEKEVDKKNGVVAGQNQRDLLPTWQRMVPLWASGLGVLTDALGITNRPDYSDAASLEALASKQRGFMPVSYKPIGERMRTTLFDPYQAMIAGDAASSALRRALQDNSNGNAAMRNAALISADRNAALARGQLAQQGQLFNAQNYERALRFNRETDAQNSQGIMSADVQNAHNWRLGQGAYASLFGQALGLRQAERQAANAARAANLSNFVKGMSNYGKENAYINMVNTNAANQGYGYGDRRFGIDYRSPFFQIPE